MKIGTSEIIKVYLGTINISKVYLGYNNVYQEGSLDSDTVIINNYNKLYSNFSDNHYITIPQFYTSDMISFSETICFSVDSFGVSNMGLIDGGNNSTSKSTRLTITTDGYLHFRMSENGSETYAVDITGDIILDLNKFIYAKVEYDISTGYKLQHSYDGTNWITDGTSSINSRPYSGSGNLLYIGDNSATGYSLLGTIDIAKTKFTLNGTTIFDGATAVEGIDYIVVGESPSVTVISQVGLTTGLISAVETDNLYEVSQGHNDAVGLTTGLIGAVETDNLYETSQGHNDAVGLTTGIISAVEEDVIL